jgi:hypothetical protein
MIRDWISGNKSNQASAGKFRSRIKHDDPVLRLAIDAATARPTAASW